MILILIITVSRVMSENVCVLSLAVMMPIHEVLILSMNVLHEIRVQREMCDSVEYMHAMLVVTVEY